MLSRAGWQTGPVIESELLVVSEQPLNAETPLATQEGRLTRTSRHYVRNHFPIPAPPDSIAIDGAVASALALTLDDLRALGARTLAVTLECAGNGRRFLDPPVPGEQWGLGAVGTAEWRGVPLRALLRRAGVRPNAVEIVFRGADEGEPQDLGRRIAYERSLPLADALRDDVLVAWGMNGDVLPAEHGAPFRLVVPGWYGMASVKWLARITAVERPFTGFYQLDRYVIDGAPLRAIRPRAVITAPVDGATIRAGALSLRGYAWSGSAPLARVEVSAGPHRSAASWREAELAPATAAYVWREFRTELLIATGSGGPLETTLLARATDAAGHAQPLEPKHNVLGYANNAVSPVRVRVVP